MKLLLNIPTFKLKLIDLLSYYNSLCNVSKGPFTLAILGAIFAAILLRFQIARVNYWRFKSPRNRQ